MRKHRQTNYSTPTRREALQIGAIGFMGLGLADLSALQAPLARSVIFVFLTGSPCNHVAPPPEHA